MLPCAPGIITGPVQWDIIWSTGLIHQQPADLWAKMVHQCPKPSIPIAEFPHGESVRCAVCSWLVMNRRPFFLQNKRNTMKPNLKACGRFHGYGNGECGTGRRADASSGIRYQWQLSSSCNLSLGGTAYMAGYFRRSVLAPTTSLPLLRDIPGSRRGTGKQTGRFRV